MPAPRLHALALALAAGLALLSPTTSAAPAALPTDSMAQRVAPCVACHGDEGRATPEGYLPRIAGKPAGYLHHQLLNFRDGRRLHSVMTYLVERQRDDYLREMAEYFAARHPPYPPPPPAQADAAALAQGRRLALEGDAARGLPACQACHGERLTGVLPASPGLLGLPRDYLLAQLGAWKVGSRKAAAPDCMASIAQSLSLADIDAVTAWLAAQPVPTNPAPSPPATRALPRPCGSQPGGAAP